MSDENFSMNDDELLDWHYLNVTVQIIILCKRCQAEIILLQAIADLDFKPQQLSAVEYYAEVQHLRAKMDSLIAKNFAPEAMQARNGAF